MSYMSAGGTPLKSIERFPKKLIDALKASGISTVEQFVATTATAGASNMASHLGIKLNEFLRHLERAEAALPAAELAQLKRPADTSDYGLGVPLDHPPD